MSSMHRALDGTVLIHHLTADARLIDAALLGRTGRSARTLVKEGPLRLVIMAMAPDSELPRHHADGPVTIQVLEGEVRFSALAQEYPLIPGDVLVLAAGVEHAAWSTAGALFLLTVIHASGTRADAEVPHAASGRVVPDLSEVARRRWQDDGGRQPDEQEADGRLDVPSNE